MEIVSNPSNWRTNSRIKNNIDFTAKMLILLAGFQSNSDNTELSCDAKAGP